MFYQSNCPACGKDIPNDRILSGTAVCACGWTDDKTVRDVDQQIEMRQIKAFMAFAIAVILGFGHLLNWGSHAATIPFLKAAQMTGVISEGGLQSILTACFSLSKWSCVEDTYGQLYAKTGNIETLAELAHFQKRAGKTLDALKTYETYVARGGNETEALYRYASLVEESGDRKFAIELFAKSVAASTERLPVRAMGSLIRLFMAEGRNQEAMAHLTAFHKSSGNAENYYVSEMEKLKETIRRGKKVANR